MSNMQIPNIMYKIRDGLIAITFISFILLGLSLLLSGCDVEESKDKYDKQKIYNNFEKVQIDNNTYYIYTSINGNQVISYTKDSLEIELMREKLEYYQEMDVKYVN